MASVFDLPLLAVFSRLLVVLCCLLLFDLMAFVIDTCLPVVVALVSTLRYYLLLLFEVGSCFGNSTAVVSVFLSAILAQCREVV